MSDHSQQPIELHCRAVLHLSSLSVLAGVSASKKGSPLAQIKHTGRRALCVPCVYGVGDPIT